MVCGCSRERHACRRAVCNCCRPARYAARGLDWVKDPKLPGASSRMRYAASRALPLGLVHVSDDSWWSSTGRAERGRHRRRRGQAGGSSVHRRARPHPQVHRRLPTAAQLQHEVAEAGFAKVRLVGIEGPRGARVLQLRGCCRHAGFRCPSTRDWGGVSPGRRSAR